MFLLVSLLGDFIQATACLLVSGCRIWRSTGDATFVAGAQVRVLGVPKDGQTPQTTLVTRADRRHGRCGTGRRPRIVLLRALLVHFV